MGPRFHIALQQLQLLPGLPVHTGRIRHQHPGRPFALCGFQGRQGRIGGDVPLRVCHPCLHHAVEGAVLRTDPDDPVPGSRGQAPDILRALLRGRLLLFPARQVHIDLGGIVLRRLGIPVHGIVIPAVLQAVEAHAQEQHRSHQYGDCKIIPA